MRGLLQTLLAYFSLQIFFSTALIAHARRIGASGGYLLIRLFLATIELALWFWILDGLNSLDR